MVVKFVGVILSFMAAGTTVIVRVVVFIVVFSVYYSGRIAALNVVVVVPLSSRFVKDGNCLL